MTQYLTQPVTSPISNYANLWNIYDDVSTLSDVLASNYLGALQALGHSFQAQDAFYINYVGGSGLFQPSFSGSVITLSALSGGSFVTSVAITAAQFNGMYAAPKLLVPAMGANKLIILDKLELLMTYGAANYASGGVVAVQYDSTANGAGVIASTTNLAASFQAAASTTFTFNRGAVVMPFSTTVNKGLYLSNITGAFTTGDSTFAAKVFFSVVQTA